MALHQTAKSSRGGPSTSGLPGSLNTKWIMVWGSMVHYCEWPSVLCRTTRVLVFVCHAVVKAFPDWGQRMISYASGGQLNNNHLEGMEVLAFPSPYVYLNHHLPTTRPNASFQLQSPGRDCFWHQASWI
jgi:hypothetical protein